VNDTFGDNNVLGKSIPANQSASIVARVSVPIYEAGLDYSRVREAKQLASQRRIQVIEIARAVRQAVAQSWNAYFAFGDIIRNAKTQVSAAQLALSGVQQEYQAGTRTTLDVLNAQQDIVAARTLLVTAERDRVVAAYQLLAAVGHLTARDLGLNVAIYDPEKNYNRVRNKWIGTDVETIE
jgi:outer membrane protein TolC